MPSGRATARGTDAIRTPLSLRAPGSAGTVIPLTFSDLSGWSDADHAGALAAYLATCSDAAPDCRPLLGPAREALADGTARRLFETHFRPIVVGDPAEALITGYYEPELAASAVRTPDFPVPIHRPPADLSADAPWASRAEIEARGLLDGLELAWLADRLDAFLLQVQGSGRLRMRDGTVLRVGYAGKNGHPYRSIGQDLIRRGAIPAEQISADAIRRWARANPDALPDLLRVNPSYVFFREIASLAPEAGPIGTMGAPLTPGISLAVDPAAVPLGSPVWLEVNGPEPIRRLTVAQDTGSAIVGPQRADLFLGSGDIAGRAAGQLRHGGRLVQLLPGGPPRMATKG